MREGIRKVKLRGRAHVRFAQTTFYSCRRRVGLLLKDSDLCGLMPICSSNSSVVGEVLMKIFRITKK